MGMFTPAEREQMKARAAEILRPYTRKAKAAEERKRKRLNYRRGRGHPNWGKTRALVKGRWRWDEEAPVSPEEAQLPDFPALAHNSPSVTAKRRHRLRVWGFEKSTADSEDTPSGGCSPESRLLIKWDIREDRENEADVKRRWTNAQQRIRRREKRRAAREAATTG
jgi:hypothetical protein